MSTEKILQRIFDNLDASIYVTDIDTSEIIFANKRLKSFYPYNIEGEPCWKVLAGGSGDCSYCKKEELLKLGPERTLSWTHFQPDLNTWVQMSDVLIPWPDGRTVHLSCSIDITELKTKEEELNKYKEHLESLLSEKTESEQRIKSLNDNLFNGFIYQLYVDPEDHDTYISYISASHEKVCGRKLDGTAKSKFSEFSCNFHPDDQENKKEKDLRSAPYKGFVTEKRYIKPDGQVIWLQFSETPHTNSQGDVSWDGLTIDISDRKRMEMELIASREEAKLREQKIQMLNDNMINSAMYRNYYDSNGKLIFDYAGAQWDKITGIPFESFKDNVYTFIDKIHPEDKTFFSSLTRESGTSLDERTIDFRYFKGNDMRWLRLQSVGFKQDGIIYRDGMISDVTEQKNLEIELIKARDKAEESDRLKSTFLANMSHEIRTPMNAIIGFLSLLKNSDLPVETQHEYMRIVSGSADQLLKIIDDILDISKIDAGQMKIIPVESEINGLLHEIKSVYEASLLTQKNKKLALIVDDFFAEDFCYFMADSARLRQVLGNLIANAIKFTEKGYVKFGYKVIEEGLQFYVEDTGIGISEEHIKELGKPFHQVHDLRETKYGGTGIGLAISMNLVRLMGGEFHITSKVGIGSRFEFNIKAERIMKGPSEKPKVIPKIELKPPASQPVSLPAEAPVPPKNTDNSMDLSGLTILVAEDMENNFYYLQLLLKSTQVNLIHAWNGQEAVELTEKHPEIDLVLMDVKMPVMDGITATRLIKTKRPDLVILAQTAYNIEDQKQLIEADYDGYISKPIRKDVFFNKLNTYLFSKKIQT